jgi:hypothetical protein
MDVVIVIVQRHYATASAAKVPCIVVEPAYLGSNSQLGMSVCIFLIFFLRLAGAILSMVGDISIDIEAPVMTLPISRIY